MVNQNKFQILQNECSTCVKCSLSSTRNNVVFGRGNQHSKLFVIGEGPGQQEDEQGLAFVGRAGKMLDSAFQSVGIDTNKDCYISNIVKCKPSNNKAPSVQESHSCSPYLFKQIELINPKLIVALGEGAYKYLTNEEVSISKIRDQIQNYKKSQLLLTYHPSFLLRNPTLKKDAYYDMLKIKDFMEL